MKRPEDKLESLYQERLRDREVPVNERVWERVHDRVGHGGRRRRYLWWSLSLLIVLVMGGIAWSSIDTSGSEDPKNSGSKIVERVENVETSKDPAKKERESSDKPKEEAEEKSSSATDQQSEKEEASVEAAGDKGPEKASAGGSFASEGKESRRRQKGERGSSKEEARGPSEQEAEKPGEKDTPSESGQKRNRQAGGKEEPPSASSSNPSGKESVEDPEAESPASKSKPESERETDKDAGDESPGLEKGREKDKGEESSGKAREKDKSVGEADEKESSEDKEDSSKEPKQEPESSGTLEKEENEKEPAKEEQLPRMPRRTPEAEAVQEEELPQMGKEPEPIEISKGSQAIESFFIRGIGSYGWSYRSLEGLRGQELADHRNKNESSINSFSYGIESGVRWSNGFGAGLGLERNLFGSDFSYSGTEVLRDSSFSTDTNKTYIDSTWYTYDSAGNPIDTNTVIIDSNTTYNRDTTVSERDSSYEHEHSIRYRYVTIPISFSYRFEIGERFTLVPTAGFGLNFLTRASAGWVEPESEQKISYSYPSDPPFKRFVLSFRGRLALRYELARNWRIGAGFRYSRFLSSIYTDEMRVDERPYHYGGSFSLTYLLRN